MPVEKRHYQPVSPDMREIKRAAKEKFGHIAGVRGFGIGDHSLRIYVISTDTREKLPTMFKGVRVDYVITGDIVAR
jgi:hypothetical protein